MLLLRAHTCVPEPRSQRTVSQTAENYFAAATVNQGCFWTGCKDSTRPNYDPSATYDSGICDPIYKGCMNSNANNYDVAYTFDDGSYCSIGGCQDPTKANYNAYATFSDYSCAASRRLDDVQAVDVPELQAVNRRELQTGVDCLDPAASNYNAAASSHTQSFCEYYVLGCTDSNANNYMATAEYDYSVSDCEYRIPGCTVSTALNYDPSANALTGCTYPQNGCTDPFATNVRAPHCPLH